VACVKVEGSVCVYRKYVAYTTLFLKHTIYKKSYGRLGLAGVSRPQHPGGDNTGHTAYT
jgi:hypothetical protein